MPVLGRFQPLPSKSMWSRKRDQPRDHVKTLATDVGIGTSGNIEGGTFPASPRLGKASWRR